MEKLVGRDKDEENTYRLLSQQNRLEENQFNLLPFKIDLDGEKQRQKLEHLPSLP